MMLAPLTSQHFVFNKISSVKRVLLYTALIAALSITAVHAQSENTASANEDAKTLDAIKVIGSRARGHTATDTPAPVDLIDTEQLNATGSLEIGQILATLQPSFNFSRTFVSDGTDIIRPATLRALGPDQVLVLVNGKRRHQQALVNVQQTIGRGSAGTDINAIPLGAIERIEVLRDGAAAQYGSDAISGVINLVLKRDTNQSQASLQAGETYEGDGQNLHGSFNTGTDFGNGAGYLNLTAEYRDREETNRAGPDLLRVNPPRVTQRLGDADATDAYLWLNSGFDIGEGQLYLFGGYSQREGNSSGFFRSAGDGRTVPALYPNGFLPTILTTAKDQSMAIGYTSPIGTWTWDLSANYGRSRFDFREENSVNVSWWYEPTAAGGIAASSPTEAETGSLIFNQTTINLDFRGPIEWGIGSEALYLAAGAEFREDNYKILAGDPVSYTYGRTNNRALPIFNQNGTIAAPGIQGFPGFTPETAVDNGRDNVTVYVDAESRLTESFLLGIAARWEDYSDFGTTTTGKISARFDASDAFAIRGTVASGFRAPGVQQSFYSQVSTNFNAAGVLTDTLTARQDSAVTRAFGIQPLQEETSLSGSLGMTWTPSDQFSLTIDLFRIDIEDRIVFSSNISPEDAAGCAPDNSNCPIRAILDPLAVGQVLFFTNAIDTETTGVDLVADYNTELGADWNLNLTALAHFNKTEVTERRSQSAILSPTALFDDTQVRLIEEGQPGSKHVLQGIVSNDRWDFLARANYYGSVSGDGFTPGLVQTWSSKWLADIAVGYRFNNSAKLTVGGNNVFDEYPDRWTAGVIDPNDPNFNNPFPALGFIYGWETLPFGINGGYYYARVDFSF